MNKTRKTPLRRCAGCGASKDKRELIRIVRDQNGVISVDETGRRSGRGVYVCRNLSCLEKAWKTKALEKSLHHPVDPSVYQELQAKLGKETSD